MDKRTVFDEIPLEMLNKFYEKGLFYESFIYINIFRWMWNELHIHPNIMSFPGDPENRTIVSFMNPKTRKNEKVYIENNYDEIIIASVEYLYRNIDDYVE